MVRIYPGEQRRESLIRNDLCTGEFQEAYWSWLAATSHNTWFFLSEELRACSDDDTAHAGNTLPRGSDTLRHEAKRPTCRARVLKSSLCRVQRAVSKFNDQPDSWSHSGSSYQIPGRLVPCRSYDRPRHENLLEIRPFLTLATTFTRFRVIDYHKSPVDARTYTPASKFRTRQDFERNNDLFKYL